MRTALNLTTWNRKEHFEFFSSFDEPFFGITTTLDFSIGYQKVKDLGCSYFLYYLYTSLKAVNRIETFRYRIEHGKVFVYDTIHASPTIGREDHTFGFSFLRYDENFDVFLLEAEKEIERIKNSIGLCHTDDTKRIDTIHYSSIPWYTFTSLSHARHYQYKDSAPKISFGQYTQEQGKVILPISIHVHHGLMDGYHVGLYLEEFQQLLNAP
ncbi:chloramphenicol acetyltransferase [Aquimarina sp. RZ0]|uniref:chloramphenicol acetyltransferase n=1 Tax=Aquimarina sp. RZ0 TaxID=2607730 RepID=UPI0011F1E777|nr:chloramphenicol acetyltransferase [Aquimarina sp. RZ0]KAA1246360.1 chloramphenicol acetyltransferase [Aquimarina sp. RZ0]